MTQRKPRAISELDKIEITNAPFDDTNLSDLDILAQEEEGQKSNFTWSKIFLSALGILLSLAVGLWVDDLIRTLFSRYIALGWFALVIALLGALAFIIFVFNEIRAILRLRSVAEIRFQARDAVMRDDMNEAKYAIRSLNKLVEGQPLSSSGRKVITALENDIIDGRGLIHIAEAEILRPLDKEARNLILAAAKRVSVVTAVSPRAFVDIIYVFYESTKLIRAIATLYGCRPSRFGFIAILRKVLSHLAVTGTIAMGDSFIQQFIGQGLAARLSAKLGEGVVNGLMTTRIGIAAMDALRPFPFDGEKRPTIGDFAGDLINFSNKD
ncbi:TIGR01620 family protein [Bartonella sp. HY329]|uniref:YcjF family protein n=1 Tax=unclassified Bartonella TaxID=2645622 RepID=UPI0021C8DBC0|nr:MULTISPECIES: TIGR01620 family protein [unclassified Bartonella]UXM94005.1 TIGR01620 family protein [Bartonella sp. HY329]UXN08327.1 TIGR01620 family protein [Bartonella sp. HY328]